MPRFVTHLEGAIDGERLPADKLLTVHKDRPIWVRYDLAAVGKSLTKQVLRGRHETLWRYRELLPYAHEESVVSLGERMSPLLRCERLGNCFGSGCEIVCRSRIGGQVIEFRLRCANVQIFSRTPRFKRTPAEGLARKIAAGIHWQIGRRRCFR